MCSTRILYDFSLESIMKPTTTRLKLFLPKKASRLRFMSMLPYENDIFVLQKRAMRNLFIYVVFLCRDQKSALIENTTKRAEETFLFMIFMNSSLLFIRREF